MKILHGVALRGIGSVMSVYARWLREFPPRASLRKAYAARLNSATSKRASEGNPQHATRYLTRPEFTTKQNAIDTNTLTPKEQEWIKWASDKADWLDPLINKPDEILDR